MGSSFTHSSNQLIGERVKFFREKQNLTLQEFADLLGVDRQYVWNIENGNKNMTFNYLDKIIAKLNCKQEDFLNLNNPTP